MTKFFKHIIVVFVITVGLMIVLDVSYSYVFKKSEARSKIQSILQQKNTHYDYIFLGSSRTENHIDCEIIKKITGKSCVNYGISGGSIGDMLVLIKLLNAKGISYNEVMLQIDYSYNHKGLSENFKARLMPFIDEPAIKQELDKVSIGKSNELVPFYRYMTNDKVIGFREFFSSILGKKPKTDLAVGFAPKVGIGDGLAGSFPEKIKESNLELQALEQLVVSRGKSISYFTAPYCPKIKNREYFTAELSKRFKNYTDYSSLFNNEPKYFFNCGHLNIEGAREFSKILSNTL